MTILSAPPVASVVPKSVSAPQNEDAAHLMRILVIEDDRDAAEYLIKGLREHGYSVDHAAPQKPLTSCFGQQWVQCINYNHRRSYTKRSGRQFI